MITPWVRKRSSRSHWRGGNGTGFQERMGFFHDRRSRLDDGRLRIGYVSPDFREHSVSYFFLPLLAAHDRREVEVFCYAEVKRPDKVTDRIKTFSDHWRSTVGLTADALARRVYEDKNRYPRGSGGTHGREPTFGPLQKSLRRFK